MVERCPTESNTIVSQSPHPGCNRSDLVRLSIQLSDPTDIGIEMTITRQITTTGVELNSCLKSCKFAIMEVGSSQFDIPQP
jgi:hypothetical protein